MPGERMRAGGRHQREPREDPLRDAPIPGIVLALAAPENGHARAGLLHGELHVRIGLDVLLAGGVHVQGVALELVAVDERHMRGVDAALHCLQIVALLLPPGNVAVRLRDGAPLERRRRGLELRRAHVGPHQTAALDARVRLDGDLARGLRLRRKVHALAVHVVFPAMVRAAQAALLVPPEEKRGGAMRAEFVDQPGPSLRIAKRDEPLAEKLDTHRGAVRLGDLPCQHHRDPVAAHHPAHGRSRAGADQHFSQFLAHRATPPLSCSC